MTPQLREERLAGADFNRSPSAGDDPAAGAPDSGSSEAWTSRRYGLAGHGTNI
jgi:hypothetical protein